MREVYKEAIAVMKPAIDLLLAHYEGFSNQHTEPNDHPKKQLEEFLNLLDVYYPGADKRRLKLAIRQCIISLNCFKYRVIATKTNASAAETTSNVWNPLEQPLTYFLTKHQDRNITYRPNNHPYPTADLISDWVSCQINEHISKN